MKVTIELETPEEQKMLGADSSRFLNARSTAVFFRREMVPVSNYMDAPVGYKEKLYIEVALEDLRFEGSSILDPPLLTAGDRV